MKSPLKKRKSYESSSSELVRLVENIEARCMAADGPVTPTLREATDREAERLRHLSVFVLKRKIKALTEDILREAYKVASGK